ncbi:MAG: hypothetical protein ACR2NB_14670 [Solirubrobacteraceae bacterium]
MPAARGFWQYACPSAPRIGLAEVRASLGYGHVKPVTKRLAATWAERLDFEAGLLARRPAPLEVPASASWQAQSVAEGMSLLLGLRSDRFPFAMPFLFARKFSMAWCGISDLAARRGGEELEDSGVVHRVGRHGESNYSPVLWMPGLPVQPSEVERELAWVESFKREFDATELPP